MSDLPPLVERDATPWPNQYSQSPSNIPPIGAAFPGIQQQFPGTPAGGGPLQWPASPPPAADAWGMPQAFANPYPNNQYPSPQYNPYPSPGANPPPLAAPAPLHWGQPGNFDSNMPYNPPPQAPNWIDHNYYSPPAGGPSQGYELATYEPRTGESTSVDLPISPRPRPSTPYKLPRRASHPRTASATHYDRPANWRTDFRMPRSAFDVILPHKREKGLFQNDVTLKAYIRYAMLREPPMTWDLHVPPSGVRFRELERSVTTNDLYQFASEPPSMFMRLYHSRLPWYIDVYPSQPVGITLQDLFTTIHTRLFSRATHSDLYNSDVSEEAKRKVVRAYSERCNGSESVRNQGVLKVDFLMRDYIFLGLAKGNNGMWEMKTRKM